MYEEMYRLLYLKIPLKYHARKAGEAAPETQNEKMAGGRALMGQAATRDENGTRRSCFRGSSECLIFAHRLVDTPWRRESVVT
jgi:hypothetical protein